MQDGKKVREVSETGEIEIYDLIEDEKTPTETDSPPNDIEELTDAERLILDEMRDTKSESGGGWAAISVGQPVEVAGAQFKISHISKGFLILEADRSVEGTDKERVWKQLQRTGARSLIRIDGTPFYVETRVLSCKEVDETSGE